MSNTIWVVAEHHNGEFESITLELLGKAKQLGGSVQAVVLGSGVKDLAGKLGAYGAEKVYVADHAELANYRAEVYGTLLAKLVEEHKPGLVLFGATSLGSDLASHTGAHLKAPVASNASNLVAEGGGVKIVRPVYGGNAFATLSAQGGSTVLVTVEAKSFEKAAEAGGSAEVVEVAVDPAVLSARVQIKEFVEAVKSGKIPLNEAEVVVAGGRGVGGADKFAIIEELASALG
ncbi:MAG: electron transfer flavoprotein subunit alpha/FixB family protein, partial [Candidatus Sericytochromatia bacterium]